jgi:hypothetical protein
MKTKRHKTTIELKNIDKLRALSVIFNCSRTQVLETLIENEFDNQNLKQLERVK